MTSYKSIGDAARVIGDEGLVTGKTKIWYWKPEVASYYQKGYEWLRDEGIPVPDVLSLSQSHVRVGAIAERDPTRALELMRRWSPAGEADELIHGLGLSHTNMAVGDIIHLPNGRLLMVDIGGFAELGVRRAKPSPVKQEPPKQNNQTVESLVRRLLS